MADDARTPTAEPAAIQLEGGTYEVIRNRLQAQARELRNRLEQLNQARKEVFGAIETRLVSTERITTEHNCIPRDLVAVGNRFIFGYNVHLGLKTETQLSDVFAVYELREGTFHQHDLELIRDERFERDLREVYRYYRHAVFAKFSLIGPHLFMVFRVGQQVSDIKTFKWALDGSRLVYLDNRSDHEFRYPPQYEFPWVRTTRDQHRPGVHPHISIEDRVFVETVGGDLTIKIENNTDSGEGIYAEDVENKDQTLDDGEFHYAIVGNLILLKIRPYLEREFRYIVYNEKIQRALRLDSLAHACVLLPDDHGIIFANGYYLQSGEYKVFENEWTDMLFERRLAAPNGEDYLYVFYNRDSGEHVLLRYNVIEQQLQTPLPCNGAAFFPGGELILFRAQQEPQKHHALQIWQTPYLRQEIVPPAKSDSLLFKIGNRDLVRAMAECHEVLNLIAKEDTYGNLYVDLAKLAGDVCDSYFWIDSPECFCLQEVLAEIRGTASAAIEEFEKVTRLRENTASETRRVAGQAGEILAALHRRRFEHVDDFVRSLAELRAVRGEIISLRDLRYVHAERVQQLETEVVEQADRLAQRCVQFLLDPRALEPYAQRVDQQAARIDSLARVRDARQLETQIGEAAQDLELLIDIVSNLKIDDALQRTTIVDHISAIFARVNTARAGLKRKIKELLSVEGVAEFASQMKLLNQSVVNYLDVSETPEKCEELLTRLMIQLEELEGRFAEFDEFVQQLTEKRDEIYNAFETRKLQLVEARNRRAGSLARAAERILKGIQARVGALPTIQDIHSYFAADLMIQKVRDLIQQLADLGDSVKVDDLQSQLKTIREDAVRQLKDRQELFVDGAMIIRLGKHRFSVNVQPLELTTVLREEQMCFHLSGTNFFEPIEDPELLELRDFWEQEVVSENRHVYRGEYLAYQLLQYVTRPAAESDESVPTGAELLARDDAAREAFIQRFMGPRYHESYSKGVHDHDAGRLLVTLLEMQNTIGLLRFSPPARAMAQCFWRAFGDREQKRRMQARLAGFATVARLFPDASAQQQYRSELLDMLDAWARQTGLFEPWRAAEAADYLFAELSGEARFVVSRHAVALGEAFHRRLRQHDYTARFHDSLQNLQDDPTSTLLLLRDWVSSFLDHRGSSGHEDGEYVDEVALLLWDDPPQPERVLEGLVTREVDGLVGSHPQLQQGTYRLNYNHFLTRLSRYEREVVPRFRRYVARKKELVQQARHSLRLDEFKPRVLTSFVRNRLIDQVYLPLIGDNLAKQIGVAGEAKRTDRMGLLLVISPPGYGKTTLMEYIANRLGIIFMKINGPAVGHQVTSLDPAEASNAAAREELHKLNLALEMGDNVMIYVDDIQHCHPEFLQKFISLCDAQRKIEGVYRGRTRTYDLRGRKICVVMAGNPYTESGEVFQIPDMLANRADIYNLGEIIGDTRDVFEMSYLENCLTSNPVLNQLAARSQQDVYAILRMAQEDVRQGVELEGNYSLEEINDFVITMRKLLRVRDVVLQVNQQYIRSAAQADEYRTEPPFLLQGSYRNMNRIAERVLPIMNDQELESLILSNYENDAQTLTRNTEANLLKFKELLGRLNPEEARRWEDIRRTFQQNLRMKGIDTSDQVGQVIVQLREFSDGLYGIRQVVAEGVRNLAERAGPERELFLANLLEHARGLHQSLETIGGAIRQAAEAGPQRQSPEPLAQQVVVQHRVPRNILDVLRAQFDLMRNWLQPLQTATVAQREETQQLRASLETCLAQYAALMQDLERAENKQPPPPPRR